MTNSTSTKWQSILNFMEAFESTSAYPEEQVRQLRMEVAALTARVERNERGNAQITP